MYEKIKAEIERINNETSDTTTGRTLDEILAFIDSLQQEQSEKSKKDCNGCPHCVDRKDQYGWHFKGCFGGPYKGKFIAEIDECPLKQEQPKVDLEIKKQIEELANDWHHKGFASDEDCPLCMQDLMDILWHFYELGKNSK